MKLRKKPALNSHDTGAGDYITQVFNQILNRLKIQFHLKIEKKNDFHISYEINSKNKSVYEDTGK